MIRTLRRRFIVVTLSALFVLLLTLVCCVIAAGYYQMEGSADSFLRMLAEGEWGAPPPPDERSPAFGYQIRPGPLPMRYFVAVLDEDGHIASKEQSGISGEDQDAIGNYCEHLEAQDGTSGKFDAYKYLAVLRSDGCLAIAFLDNSIQVRMLSNMLMASVGVIFGCMLLMFLISLPVSSWAARSYAANVEKQRQFITNAGHELKTPVAIIQSNVDAMELIAGSNKWTRNIRGQTERLTQLVKQLLLLARMEENNASRHFEQLDFGALIQKEIEFYREPMRLKGLCFGGAIEEHVLVEGNVEALEQLIHVLMDNAVSYAQEGGRVDVRLQAKGRKVQMSVRNSTDALPDAPPSMLFERFYRADTIRARAGGYGIGLSAARLIAETHRGRIEASYENGRDVLIVVDLPRVRR